MSYKIPEGKEKDRSPVLWGMSYKKIETIRGVKGSRIQVK
jgi:hypothetical protein